MKIDQVKNKIKRNGQMTMDIIARYKLFVKKTRCLWLDVFPLLPVFILLNLNNPSSIIKQLQNKYPEVDELYNRIWQA